MSGDGINVVWLKRDLRLRDHAPLAAAEAAGLPYRIIYCHEPQLITHPDTSLRHLQFIHHSIAEMNVGLAPYNRVVEVFHADAIAVMAYIHSQHPVRAMWSYQESGVQVTWERDKRVAAWCKANGVLWKEFQRDGIVRGIRDREGWDRQWYAVMNSPQELNPYSHGTLPALAHPFPIPEELLQQWSQYPGLFQPAGERNAWRYLQSWVEGRGFRYHKLISKPSESRQSCGRISPYLAWGNLSIRQVVQFLRSHAAYGSHKLAFDGLLTRLKWHCHFIQKFEVECSYETACINRGYESLGREDRPDWVAAWKEGRTGFPMVDANMRCVAATGWINFRMRAMCVSFLCHHLRQDWRAGAYHLAQQFLDYEPGIHYPQFQMQAGTTGINTVRIYNPVKQGEDHDAQGAFVRKWVPELARVPDSHVHRPWTLTALEQEIYGFRMGVDYPSPIVDLKDAARTARVEIWGHRKDQVVRQENQRILRRHTRRKSEEESPMTFM